MVKHLNRMLRAVRAHFTEPRCRQCGIRRDRDDGMGCITPRMWSAFHVYPGGPGPMLTGAAPGNYDDEDD